MSNDNSSDTQSLQATVLVTPNSTQISISELSSTLGISEKGIELTVIKPEKTMSISVEQIRDVIMEASKKSINDKIRVFAFLEADKMKDVAQNSLLKILEEPPQGILLVLITQNAEDILQTILSRCRIIKDMRKDMQVFNALDENFLLEKVLLTKAEAHQTPKLVWKDNNLRQNVLELQSISNKLSDSVDEQKIAKLWLFNLWVND